MFVALKSIRQFLASASPVVLMFAAAAVPAAAADYTVTTTGGAIAITDTAGIADTLTLSQPSAGNIRFSASSRTFSVDGGADISGDSGSLGLTGITLVTVNAGAGADVVNVNMTPAASSFPGLTINGGTGDDTVNLNGTITFATGRNLDIDLQNDAPTPGIDAILMSVGSGYVLSGTGTATFRASKNVQIAGRLATADGPIILENNQQAVAATGNFQGVNVLGTAVVENTGTGTINVLCRGGNDPGGQQNGFRTNTGALVRGGTAGNAVTVTGVGGASAGNGVFIPNGSVRSLGGNILLTGIGAGTNTGVTIQNSGVVAPGPNGNVVIDAKPATPTGAVASFQLFTVATNPTGVFTTGTGSITLIADSVSIGATNVFSFLNAGPAGTVKILPKTAGTAIDIGSTGALATAGVLELSDAELDRVVAGTLQIGDSNSGTTTISNLISPASYETLSIGKAFAFTAGATTGGFESDLTSASVYEKIVAAGPVTIDPAATLAVAAVGGFMPTSATYFVLINNTSTGAVTGTFAGKAEADLVNVSGVQTPISYVGGNGNDVSLGTPDISAPVIDPHADVIAEATSAAGAVVTYAPATATDNIAVTSLAYSHASGGTFPIGVTVVTITASDDGGNSATSTFKVTVQDTTEPVIASHADVGPVEATSAAGAVVTYAPVTATDAVGVSSMTYSHESGGTFPLGVTTVTVTASDAAGNSSTSTFSVTVSDTTKPVIAAHINVGPVEATSAAGAVVTYSAATAMDNVGVTSLTYSRASGSTFPPGVTPVTITAADAAGNSITSTFFVTVRDTTAPNLAARADVGPIQATSAAGAVVTYAASTATDSVGVTSLAYSRASGSTFPIGVTTVTVTARDAAGNTATRVFNVTVSDTSSPVITAHADVGPVEATSAAGAVVAYAPATATDNVAVSSLTYSHASGSTFPLGATQVVITASDAAGNTVTSIFHVTVSDTTKPAIATHANVGPVEATSAAGAVVTYSAATATDSVGVTSLTYSQASGSTFPLGVTPVTITAADAAGNSITSTFDVTVSDTTKPAIAAHANVGPVEATSAAGAVVTYSAATATDNVAVTSLTYSPESGSTFPPGVTPVTITAADAAGNSITSTFDVTVSDTTKPVIAAHANVGPVEATSAAGAVVTYAAATATDNVGVTSLTYSQASGSTFPPGVTPVTITAADAAGNSITSTFNVTVSDTIAPVIAAPSAGFAPLILTGAPNGAAGVAALPDYAAQALVSDAVGVTSVTQTPAPGTERGVGTVAVSLTARDAAGNASEPLVFNVTVKAGNLAPLVGVNGAGPVVASATEGSPASQAGTFSDPDGNATVTLAASSGTVTQNNTAGTWSWTATGDDGPATSTVTITATDAEAAAASTSFTFTVTNAAPQASFSTTSATAEENTITPPGVSFGGQSDPSTADTTAGFRYSYDFNNDGVWDLGGGTFADSVVASAPPIPAGYFAAPASSPLTVKGRIIDKDGGITDYTAAITIRRNPVITSNGGGAAAVPNIAENTTAVTTVTATDADAGDTLSFAKTGPDSALFSINASTGVLAFLAPPDFEAPADAGANNVYNVTVTATDNGTPALSDSQAIAVTVTNVNEAPSFTKGADQLLPPGTSSPQTVAGWATAINDGDSTVVQGLTFTVTGNSNPGIFTTGPAISSNGTLTYTPNGTSGSTTITVTLTDDSSINGSPALTTTAQTFVIDNSAPPPSISLADASIAEGNAGTTLMTFTATLSGVSGQTITANYATANGTATTADNDYIAASGTLTFLPGQLTATIAVTVNGDLKVEASETLTVSLSSLVNVTGPASATGTITNDDTATISVAKITDGAESNTPTNGLFRITMSAPSAEPVGLTWFLGGSADNYRDYTSPFSFGIAIPAGQTSVDVPIVVLNDNLIEPTETVYLSLGPVLGGLIGGVTLGTPSSAILNITDDDVVSSIAVSSGSGQSATVNTAFASRLVAVVRDSGGTPLAGASVTFASTGVTASGTFGSSATVLSDASGLATAPVFTANQIAGDYTVTATTGALPPVAFTLTNNPGAATHFTVAGPSTANAGTPVNFIVSARDRFNNYATGYTGTVHLTSTDGAATLPADSTLTLGVKFFGVTFVTGSTQTVTATDTTTPSIKGTSGNVTVTPVADLAVTITDSPDPVNALGNLTYTITVTNNGPSTSAPMNVSLPLPASTTFVSANPVAAAPAVGATGTVTFSRGSLASGASATFTVVAKVKVNVVNNSVISATATASHLTLDPVPGNNSATATTTARSGADLAVSLTAAPEPVIAGTELLYTLRVRNNGPLDSESAALTFALPLGTTFVSLGSNSGWIPTTPAVGANGTVTITHPLFANGGDVSFPLIVKVGPDVPAGTTLTGTLLSGATTVDIGAGNNSAVAVSTVTTASDLSVTVSGTPATAPKESDVTYTVTVLNAGPSDAANAAVTFPVPAEMTFVSATSAAGWSATTPAVGGEGTVTFTTASLPDDGSAVFTVVVKVKSTAPNGTILTATASASAAGVDPVVGNNSGSSQAAVGTTLPGIVQVGTTGTYNGASSLFEVTVNVTNTTPAPINGFRLHVDFSAYLAAHPSLRLYNATATTAPGIAYVDVPFPAAVDAVTAVKLAFYTSTRLFPAPFTPGLTVEILPSSQLSDTNGAGAPAAFVNLPDGNKLIEFQSQIGKWYRVRYSSDLANWQDSPVPLQAGSTRMQWIDSGPPFTESPPSSVPARFYIVNEITAP